MTTVVDELMRQAYALAAERHITLDQACAIIRTELQRLLSSDPAATTHTVPNQDRGLVNTQATRRPDRGLT